MFESSEKRNKERLLIQEKTVNSEEQFIFYNQNQQHVLKYELEIVLSININRKFCIFVDSKSTIGYLSMKICDSIGQFPEFANLEGLKALNIQRKTDKGLLLCDSASSEIKDVLENGNTIICDVVTNEYWVNTSMNLSSTTKKLSVSLDLKLNTKMTIHKLKLLLLKTGMYFWMENCQFDDEFHYIYVSANCKTNKSKQNLEFEICDLTAKIVIDELTVGDIFDFNAEIRCDLKLTAIEEIFFEQIKKNFDSDKSINKIKFDEMKELTFEEFLSNKKFEEELAKLKELTRKLIKKLNNHETLRNRVYCINKQNLNNLDDDDVTPDLYKQHSLIIIMPTRNKPKPRKSANPNELSLDNQTESFTFSHNQQIMNLDESKLKPKPNFNVTLTKAITQSQIKFENNNSPVRISVLSINSVEGSQTNEYNPKDDETLVYNREQFQDMDIRTGEIEKIPNLPQEKKNLAEIIKNKILKINTLNLCPDFINYMDLDRFQEFTEVYMKIIVFKHSLTQIKIPPFRNVTKNSFEHVDIKKKRDTSVTKNNPIMKSNRRYYFVVALLMTIGVLILLFLIILLIKY